MGSETVALLNAIVCAVIALALMLYRRCDARHRPFISILAYILVLVYAAVPFQFIFDLYHESSWPELIANSCICFVIVRYRGNMAKVIDILRH